MANTVGPNNRSYKLGLIGHPVSHSLSPLMHRAALSFCQLTGTYEALAIAPPLSSYAIQSLIDEGYVGLNVTIPHKQSVLPFLSDLTPDAISVQAANTIAIDSSGQLLGHNTDVGGFCSALKDSLETRYGDQCLSDHHSNVAVIAGAGGAARAAVAGLMQMGFEHIILVARRFEQAELVASSFRDRTGSSRVQPVAIEDLSSLNRVNVLVNATPVGLIDQTVPDWLTALLHSIARSAPRDAASPYLVYDMVYSARCKAEPALVSQARSMGLPVSDGLDMLVNQAALAFQFWTGVSIPTSVMANALASVSDSA